MDYGNRCCGSGRLTVEHYSGGRLEHFQADFDFLSVYCLTGIVSAEFKFSNIGFGEIVFRMKRIDFGRDMLNG